MHSLASELQDFNFCQYEIVIVDVVVEANKCLVLIKLSLSSMMMARYGLGGRENVKSWWSPILLI